MRDRIVLKNAKLRIDQIHADRRLIEEHRELLGLILQARLARSRFSMS
jgi:hypothetical protein